MINKDPSPYIFSSAQTDPTVSPHLSPVSGPTSGFSVPVFAALKLALHTALSPRSSSNVTKWIVDSGASVNIAMSTILLHYDVDPAIPHISVCTMSGAVVQSTAAGPCTIQVINPVTGVLSAIYLPSVYVIPLAAFNLFAVQVAQNLNLEIHFTLTRPGFHGAIFRVGDLTNPICLIDKIGESLCLTCSCIPFPHHDPLLDPLFKAGLVADHSQLLHAFYPCAPAAPQAYGLGTVVPTADDLHLFLEIRNSAASDVATPLSWTLQEAHHILGHRNDADILRMHDSNLLPRIRITTRTMPPCVACLEGAANFTLQWIVFPIAQHEPWSAFILTQRLGDAVHASVCGGTTGKG